MNSIAWWSIWLALTAVIAVNGKSKKNLGVGAFDKSNH